VSEKVLILGGDGLVGQEITSLAKKNAFHAISTTRKINNNCGKILIDLLRSETWQNIPNDISHAIFLAGQTSVKLCEEESDISYHLNVVCTRKIIQNLLNKNVKVTFVSSNAVFDGVSSFYGVNDNRKPVNKYGEYKKAVEDYFFDNNNFFIVRMTKIFESMDDLLHLWICKLKKGEKINAYDNVSISPIKLTKTCEALLKTTVTCEKKILHFSSKKEITYYDLAETLVQVVIGKPLGSKCLIEPINHNYFSGILHNSLRPSIGIGSVAYDLFCLEKDLKLLANKISYSV
jgi:dTDP-4-dehydrorhamnose reductase